MSWGSPSFRGVSFTFCYVSIFGSSSTPLVWAFDYRTSCLLMKLHTLLIMVQSSVVLIESQFGKELTDRSRSQSLLMVRNVCHGCPSYDPGSLCSWVRPVWWLRIRAGRIATALIVLVTWRRVWSSGIVGVAPNSVFTCAGWECTVWINDCFRS